VSRVVSSLGAGFRSLARNWGLVALVLSANAGFALVLAVPLSIQLESDLAGSGASSAMARGLDYDWWAEWSEGQAGPSSDLTPGLLGVGFALRDIDLLLRGALPLGMFARGELGVSWAALGLGALYLLLQVFLTGGMLGVFRAPLGGWTVRGLVHGGGFYLGRLLRVSLIGLAAAGALFAANALAARGMDRLAAEAVSGRTAMVIALGRHALLLLGLLLVHMVSSYAKVLVVCEERLSAGLAVLSALGFCARSLLSALGQYAVVLAAFVALLVAFAALDASLEVAGWGAQLAALLLFELYVGARVALRLGLLASQVELYASRGR
jgi:hypothetical protein